MTAPVYPPLVAPWDGDPRFIVDETRKYLQMKLSDPNIATLERLVGSAIELVRNFLFWTGFPDDGETLVPDPVRDACISVLAEAYRRKDLTYGVLGTADPDGISFRVSADWLGGACPQLAYFRKGWGLG